MIIICKHTNQLANRIFTYLPVLSYALEAGERVCFLFQYRGYADFFPNLEKAGMKSYFPTRSLNGGLRSKMFYAVVRAVDKVCHAVLRPGERIPLREPLGFLCNPKWKEIRYDEAHISKHADTLRHLFAPPQWVEERLDRDFGGGDGIVTVGVHIRRGDYAEYLGGKYYYTDDVYKRLMSDLSGLIMERRPGSRVRFLICSNERIDPAIFAPYDIFTSGGNHMLCDLYGLSRCDYIVGPPSTFSMWASFYGRKPLLMVREAGMAFSLSDFFVVSKMI